MTARRRAIEVSIGGEDLARLVSITRSRTEPASRVERARMLLAYREDCSFFAVGRALGVHHQTVQRCVERALSVSNNGALGSGGLTLDSGATRALTGSPLTLTASANFAGGTVNGSKMTVGESSGATAILDNSSTGTWDIADNSGIGLGSSTASSIDNAGLFEKTAAAERARSCRT